MIEYRETRGFSKAPPKLNLETWTLFSPRIVEWALQPIRHGSLSSKIQAAVADVFDRI